MKETSVKRLGLILAIQAEIEAMKLQNELVGAENCKEMGYPPDMFFEKAEEIRNIINLHPYQL